MELRVGFKPTNNRVATYPLKSLEYLNIIKMQVGRIELPISGYKADVIPLN